MAAEFHDLEVRRTAHFLAELLEMAGENAPEKRADADAGEVIAAFAGACFPRAVIPVPGMVECQFHEPDEGEAPAAGGDFTVDIYDEFWFAGHADTIARQGMLQKRKLHLNAKSDLIACVDSLAR